MKFHIFSENFVNVFKNKRIYFKVDFHKSEKIFENSICLSYEISYFFRKFCKNDFSNEIKILNGL